MKAQCALRPSFYVHLREIFVWDLLKPVVFLMPPGPLCPPPHHFLPYHVCQHVMFIDVFIYHHPRVGASADNGVVHYHRGP